MRASKAYPKIKNALEKGKIQKVIPILQEIEYSSSYTEEVFYMCKIADFLFKEKMFTEFYNYTGYAKNNLNSFYNDGDAKSRLMYIKEAVQNRNIEFDFQIYEILYLNLHDTKLKESVPDIETMWSMARKEHLID